MGITEKNEDVCFFNSATRHTILCGKKFISAMNLRKTNVHAISGSIEITGDFGNATIVLQNDTILYIKDSLLGNRSNKNLLNFKNVF